MIDNITLSMEQVLHLLRGTINLNEFKRRLKILWTINSKPSSPTPTPEKK
tara:strand:- start:183 stop:332 length:150 start_codon:yes stop_codon:yes gene_type:complete